MFNSSEREQLERLNKEVTEETKEVYSWSVFGFDEKISVPTLLGRISRLEARLKMLENYLEVEHYKVTEGGDGRFISEREGYRKVKKTRRTK